MNVSMAAALFSIDAAGAPQAASGSDAKGEGFGLAVKDAAHKHGGKRAGAKDATAKGALDDAKDTKDAKGAKGARIAKGAEAAKDADASNDADAAKADGLDAAATPADLLGRLLGGVSPTPPPEPRSTGIGDGSSEEEGDEALDDGLQERIVISTVADLADAPAQGRSGNNKGISLRVTGMETHFEPRIDGATLVEAADPAAAAKPAAGESATAAPKQAFTEILQRLGNGQAGGEGGGDAAGSRREGGSEAEPSRTPARTRTDAAATQSRGAEAVVDRTTPQTREPSTGQIVNAQIAERIVEAFASPSDGSAAAGEARTTAGSDQILRMTAGGAALKTLSIQLEPQDLGRVDVSMRLVDGRLQVELAASEPSTAAALAGDRHGLRKILEHAGFALDDAAITIVARDQGQGASTPAPAAGGADGGRQAGDGRSAFDRSSDGRSSGQRQSPDGRRREADESDRGSSAGGVGAKTGSVYL